MCFDILKPYYVHLSELILSYDFTKFIVHPKHVYAHRRNILFLCALNVAFSRSEILYYLLLTFSHTKYPQFGK